MNDLAMMDKNLAIERTPEQIATEINSIKEQTQKILLINSIEIGRRLAEAKHMLPHGEWGDWLDRSVDYSQRTANNLIRIYEEYGSNQLVLFGDGSANSQALANLSYTQAVALLGIPQHEREAFAQDHDIDNMSTRELQQAIKEKQELEAKVKDLEVSWKQDKDLAAEAKQLAAAKEAEAQRLLEEKQNTDQALLSARADANRLRDTLAVEREQAAAEKTKAKGDSGAKVKQLQKELDEARKLVDKLTEELDNPVEVTAADVAEKVPEAIQKELDELREKLSAKESTQPQQVPQEGNTALIRFSVHFETLVNDFKQLLGTLSEIKDAGPDAYDKYKKAAAGLIEKMLERL